MYSLSLAAVGDMGCAPTDGIKYSCKTIAHNKTIFGRNHGAQQRRREDTKDKKAQRHGPLLPADACSLLAQIFLPPDPRYHKV